MATSSPLPLCLFSSTLSSSSCIFKGYPRSGYYELRATFFWSIFDSLLLAGNMGQRTVADWLQQKRPYCSANTLVSKGGCEAQGTRQMPLTGWWDFLLNLWVTMRGILSPPPSPHLNYTTVLNKYPREELELATNISATHGLMHQISLFREVTYRALLFALSWGNILKLFSRQQ